MDDCYSVTTGPRIIAATPHAEVVVNEPVPPTPPSEAYIPSKVMHFMCSSSHNFPTINACATQPCPAGLAFVLSQPRNTHGQNCLCVLCFCLLRFCKNLIGLKRHVAELPLYTQPLHDVNNYHSYSTYLVQGRQLRPSRRSACQYASISSVRDHASCIACGLVRHPSSR